MTEDKRTHRNGCSLRDVTIRFASCGCGLAFRKGEPGKAIAKASEKRQRLGDRVHRYKRMNIRLASFDEEDRRLFVERELPKIECRPVFFREGEYLDRWHGQSWGEVLYDNKFIAFRTDSSMFLSSLKFLSDRGKRMAQRERNAVKMLVDRRAGPWKALEKLLEDDTFAKYLDDVYRERFRSG